MLGALLLAHPAMAAEEDDEPISLSPVKKGAEKEEAAAPTAPPTAVPTPEPSKVIVLVATPTPVPTPKPRPAKRLARIDDLSIRQEDGSLTVGVLASQPLRGSVRRLENPDRLLVVFSGAMMGKKGLSKDINVGAAAKARLAGHAGDEVWLVLDLLEPVKYQVKSDASYGYAIALETGAAPAPVARRVADLPKINLMFFDLNVLYQGKQYDKFPCANFIYDKTDSFPLKRDFITTLVFHQGYGAFVGNMRILDPKGSVIDHTKEPVAFNLFSEIFDYSKEIEWSLSFPSKGFYSLILTLNGEDVLVHRFYVGHNDDRPEKK